MPHYRFRFVAILILAITATLLHGCGFQLRGSDGSSALQAIDIRGENRFDEMASEIRHTAIRQGIAVEDGAAWSIEASHEELDKWPLSTTQSATIREYRLLHSATFRILHQNHEHSPVTLSAETIFQDHADISASKDNEEAMLRRELRSRIAGNILRQVGQLAATPDACGENHEPQTTTAP